MNIPISLLQKPKSSLEQKQIERLLMTREMQQGIHFLELPQMELKEAIDKEMEENPLLEWEEEEATAVEEEATPQEIELSFDEFKFDAIKELEEDFQGLFQDCAEFSKRRNQEDEKKRSFLENSIEEEPSISLYLMHQAREVFSNDLDLYTAEVLIGSLDEAGFLRTPLKEISLCFNLSLSQLEKVISVLKTFEPIGVFSQSTQEVLLLQLSIKNKQNSLAYTLIQDHFEELIHSQLVQIHKKIKAPLSEIQRAIQEDISHLDLHPASSFSKREIPTLIPDVKLTIEGENFVVTTDEEGFKGMKLNRQYLKMLQDENLPKESKDFIRGKLSSARWLIKNIEQRGSTLLRLGKSIAERQREFFMNSKGKLEPLLMKDIAEELNLHESTIARAVSGKYFETPRGIYPFRYFFSVALLQDTGDDISSTAVKDMIKEMILKEDQKHPLSDDALSKALKEKGISCARRTVAKYRKILEIGNTKQRRRY